MAESLYRELSNEVLAISGYFWLFSKISIYYRFKTTSGSPLDKDRRKEKTSDSRNLVGSTRALKFQDVGLRRSCKGPKSIQVGYKVVQVDLRV